MLKKRIPMEDLTFAHFRYFSQHVTESTICGKLAGIYFDSLESLKKELNEAIDRNDQRQVRETRALLYFIKSLTYLIMPGYLFGRIISLFFPIICLIYNSIVTGNLINVNPLQLALTGIYIGLVLTMVIFVLPHAFQWYWVSWHILPGDSSIRDYYIRQYQDVIMEDIRNCYEVVIARKGAQQLLEDKYGTDIASIIMLYYPNSFNLERIKWYRTPTPSYFYSQQDDRPPPPSLKDIPLELDLSP